MAGAYELVHRHVEELLAAAARNSIGAEVVASNLLAEVVRLMKAAGRSQAQIAEELAFAAENAEEQDFEFMRP